ncbi:MAG TPA: L-threonylcarbamoyladenylate synthase [Pyrinomonadaceae bacterium]|nr:L-threonylcarbamoyladenylate synthase [Pyrinomonadaceae bacterium]
MIAIDGSEARQMASDIISRGGIIAFRTDTLYGLGVDPGNEAAVRALVELKGREAGKPILVIVSDASEVDRFIVERSANFDLVTSEFWPGPLTIVGKAIEALPVDLTAGTGTIGVRLPNDEGVRELVRVCGGALTATSANVSGGPPARNAEDVQQQFPSGVDLILDGGDVTVAEPSTVLDLSGELPRLIREGAVSREKLRSTLSTLA